MTEQPKTPDLRNLPKVVKDEPKPHVLTKIVKDVELAKKNDQLNKFLSSKPHNSWIKDHPTAAGVKYIPIQIVEVLLKTIFQKKRVEILDQGIMANAVWVKVRLHYMDLDGTWTFEDGLGANDIQTEKGASIDWNKIKFGAIQKGLPAAESYAIKDAAQKIGTIFGADLNRRDTILFDPIFDKDYSKALENGNS
jgi:hypothetical protein